MGGILRVHRLIANPTVVTPHISPADATAEVRQWFEREHIIPINPGARHLEYLEQYLGCVVKLF